MIFNYALRKLESQQPLLGPEPLVSLGLQIIGVIVISLLITYLLFRLMQQIDHKVKFFLILALLILVYAFGKVLHLPALVTIFIFGIFLSNVKSLLPPFLRKTLDLEATEKELHEFHILTAESTFLVRTFFFLFFGFSIQLSDFTSTSPVLYGLLIFLAMFVLRYIYFTATSLKLKPSPLVYMSPRGLISILLFLQLNEVNFINLEEGPVDERLLLIVILSSMLVMLLGTMKKDQKKEIEIENEEAPLSVEMDIEPQSLTEKDNKNL
jgi:Kef-type K+ transport system membrane component KefB